MDFMFFYFENIIEFCQHIKPNYTFYRHNYIKIKALLAAGKENKRCAAWFSVKCESKHQWTFAQTVQYYKQGFLAVWCCRQHTPCWESADIGQSEGNIIMQQIAYIITAASIVGTAANSFQKRWCFIIWICTNTFWIIYNIIYKSYAQALLYSFNLIMAIIGLIKWKDKPVNNK